MSTTIHIAIAVTGFNNEDLKKAHAKAKEIFNNELVSEIIKGLVNNQATFFIAPDGSECTWDLAEECEQKRKQFFEWLSKNASHLDYSKTIYGHL